MAFSSLIKKNSSSFSLSIFFTIIPLVMSTTIAFHIYHYEEVLMELTPIYWIGIFIASAFTMGFALTPTTFIAVSSGYLLGWHAIPGVILGYLGASLLCYSFAKKIDQGRFGKSIREFKKGEVILENIQGNEFKMTLLTKLSPVLPFAVSNILLSLAGVRKKPFIVGSFLGMLPRTLLSIWAGYTAYNLKDALEGGNNNAMVWVMAALALLTIGGVLYILKKPKVQ
ncbi:VTT domain-containing protein [Algivirga pacifica]